MLYVLIFAVGLAAGFALAWLSAASGLRAQVQDAAARAAELQEQLNAQQAARVKAETDLRNTQERLEEQRKLLDESKARLTDTFNALSAQALKSNNTAFLDLARKTLENLLTEARGDLGKRQEAIAGLVNPLAESLKRYEDHVNALEQSRQRAYGTLEQQLNALTGSEREAPDGDRQPGHRPARPAGARAAGARSRCGASSSWPACPSTATSPSRSRWTPTPAGCGRT